MAHIDNLIIMQLCGEIDTAGKEELRQWMAQSKENERYFMDKQEVWFSIVNAADDAKYDSHQAYEAFCRRIEEETSPSLLSRVWSSRWMRYAAAVVVVCLVGWMTYHLGQSDISAQLAQDITVESPMGSRTKVQLPDGTAVWLNGGSKIVYSHRFGVSDRNVSLDGEGYFEIVNGKELPFVVKTHTLEIHDIGTKFDVCDYPKDTKAMVALLEGKVNFHPLSDEKKLYDMDSNQQAIYDKATGTVDIRQEEVADYCLWTQGVLFFNGQAFADIVKILERSYNVTITVNNAALYESHFYGDFVRQEQSLREVLDALAATGKLKYKMEGKRITLY